MIFSQFYLTTQSTRYEYTTSYLFLLLSELGTKKDCDVPISQQKQFPSALTRCLGMISGIQRKTLK